MIENSVSDTGPPESTSVTIVGRRLSPHLEIILIGALILLTLICYGNMVTNSFVYDDQQQILQNPYIKSWKFLPEIFSSTVWSFVGEVGATNYYRPLMTLSFLVLWTIFGPIPFGFHLFSLALQIAVVLMVFYAGRQLFKDWRVAWLAAILFAVHPVHTEAVDWIAAFPDLEMALFFLVTFYAYSRWSVFGWKRWALLIALFALALLSKEPALMLLPVVIAFEYLVRADAETLKPYGKALRYWPFVVTAALYLSLRIALFGKLAPVLQHPQVSWPQAIYSGFALVFSYFKLLLWPSSLSAFHVFHVTNSPFEYEAVAGLIVVVGFLCAFLLLRKRAPALAFCFFWTAITLLPVLNPRWMAANVLTERYLYLPSVGFCWLAAWCAVEITEILRLSKSPASKILPALVVTCILVLCFFGVRETIARNTDWRDDRTLYTRTLTTDPHAYPILLNLALVYQQARDPKAAESEYKLAFVERPDGVNVLNNLGVLYFEQQRFTEAAEMLKKAIAVKPLWAEPHYNYGRLLEKQGDQQGALSELRLATQLAPLNAAAHLFYGDSLLSAGNLKEAASEYERSISLGPSLEAEQGLSETYIRTGNHSAAEAMLRRVITESPYDGSSHLSMARLLEQDGKLSEACTEYGKVLETDPHNHEAQSAISRLRKPDGEPKS
jgi:tetratricopeptide (TPR) repeat protein